ncbi:nucleotidyltransferase family protein [Pseudoneobacillus sp. C159]
MVKCAAILLAAGKSTRMGRLKALLPWEGTTLLQHQLAQLEQSDIHSLIVVVGYQSEKLLPYINKTSAHVVINEHVELGKTESIKRGILSVTEDHDCMVMIAVDQPVNDLLINGMIHYFQQTNSKIIIPTYKGKRGHPILFSTELRDELLQISEEKNGLREVVNRWKSEMGELEVSDPSILYNFNSPMDYEAFSKGDVIL